MSDIDNSVHFEDKTSITQINLLSIILLCPFISINRSGIFERYNVVRVRQMWVSKQTHPNGSTKKI